MPGHLAATLASGQCAQLRTYDVITGADVVVLESRDTRFEAPNWALDGRSLIVNGDGNLYRVPLESPELQRIELTGVPALNNDHVLDPDGQHIFVSAMDFQLYRAPLAGGEAQPVTDPETSDFLHFLHGVSPDGARLAFVGLVVKTDPDPRVASAEIYTVLADGSGCRQVTAGGAPADGPEFSPDGNWIYFNTEAFGRNAQIARVRADGGPVERMLASPTVDWFPHLSPDGSRAVYLSYPPGTVGHPPDLPVTIELVEDDRWSAHRTVAAFTGGQGTINVNSWSPDGSRFAYVAYPREASRAD